MSYPKKPCPYCEKLLSSHKTHMANHIKQSCIRRQKLCKHPHDNRIGWFCTDCGKRMDVFINLPLEN